MAISGRELTLERKRLVEVLKLLDDKLTEAGNIIFKDEEEKAFKEKLNSIVSSIENKPEFESPAGNQPSNSDTSEDTGFNPFGVNN